VVEFGSGGLGGHDDAGQTEEGEGKGYLFTGEEFLIKIMEVHGAYYRNNAGQR
jgi:hypothetical protein